MIESFCFVKNYKRKLKWNDSKNCMKNHHNPFHYFNYRQCNPSNIKKNNFEAIKN